ncbi:aminotransferase class I/II-fold pyridoxal phosphate-dependent enzyme [Microbacterium sp.]|uniref:aminotransferase class I/II-fold pyridoxal phosphate-dependent enzyme n=1 Tax=Microbacterium sp. TaxID=51671 RepID=UPI0039E4D738
MTGSRAARTEAATTRSPVGGMPELQAWFAAALAEAAPSGITPAAARDALIVPGSQGGLSAVFRAVVGRGQPLVVESPTYWGAILAAEQAGVVLVPIPTGPAGPDPDAVERALAHTGARAFYAQPTFANPTGGQWPVETSRAVLDTVRAHGAFLILADRAADSMYVSGLLQAAALDVVTQPGWRSHLRGLRPRLRARRDALLESVRAHAPSAHVESVPVGGLNLWLRLPEGTDLERTVRECEVRGLVVAPGGEWFPAEPSGPHLRLNYAGEHPDRFAEAARILGEVLAEDAGR